MKKIYLLFSLLIIINIVPVYSQIDQLARTNKLWDVAVPGPEHNLLYKFAGEWRQLVELPSNGGGSVNAEGAAVNDIALGGRYAEIKSHLSLDGFDLVTFIYIGFDRRVNKYSYHSFDVLSTYPYTAYGDYNKEKDQLEFKGETMSPEDPDVTLAFRITITFVNERKFIREIFIDYPEGEKSVQKVMNIRKK